MVGEYTRSDHSAFDPMMHKFLCGRLDVMPAYHLAPRKSSPPDDEGWQTVNPRRKPMNHPGHREIPVRALASPELIERYTQIYKDYFYGLTGRPIDDFRLTASTHKYVSMLTSARDRNRIISTLFYKRPKIWDLMGGSGSDILSFLLDLDPELVVACQISHSPTEENAYTIHASREDYQVMVNNILSFAKAFPHLNIRVVAPENRTQPAVITRFDGLLPTTVDCAHMNAQQFIESVEDGTEVDFVYMDPSWDDDYEIGSGEARKFELSPKELFDRLENVIWGPIRRKRIKVGCYVIKTRWNWLKVQEYLPTINSEFIATYSVNCQQFRKHAGPPGLYGERRGVFHYMILVHRDYQTISTKNDDLYVDIVQEGKPVWVRKSTVIRETMPAYTKQVKTPIFVEQDPNDEEHYFKVQPPPPLHRGGPRPA